MSNWATIVATKTEVKSRVLEAYDELLTQGYEPTEVRVMLKAVVAEAIPCSGNFTMQWALCEHWLNKERGA